MPHLERPHEVGHLGELEIQLLVGAAVRAPGAQDAHPVGLILHRLVVEQLIDGVVGVLNDIEGGGVALARGQLRGASLAAAPAFPAFAPTADENPASAVCRLVTIELGGVIHGGSLQPVGAVGGTGIMLLDVPAGGSGRGGRESVTHSCLTTCGRRGLNACGARSGSERQQSTRNNRRGCTDRKARNRGRHGTTFRSTWT